MGTTKQELYTGALAELGDRKVLTTENVAARRVLDDVYSQVLAECLEEGSWNFATEFVKLDGDTGAITYYDTGTVGRGYRYGFAKPAGYVRTHGISGDEYFEYPLLGYVDEGGIIKSDTTPIYLRYTDTGTGLTLASWPASFTRYVMLALASRVCLRLTQDKGLDDRLMMEVDKARRVAKTRDAMDEKSVKFAPPGTWTQSRWGRSGNDRGRRDKLIG